MSQFRFLLVAIALFPFAECFGDSVRADVDCPQQPLETCRWEIQGTSSLVNGRRTVHIGWEKSIVSRHREKPLASPLVCNVDRDFDMPAGGYVRVWFQGETAPCDAMRGNPATCGVTFLLDAPPDLTSSRGFTVTAPDGKTLERVEHFSTLNLQCGDFRKTYARRKWQARVGWRSDKPGDGIYVDNAPPTSLQ